MIGKYKFMYCISTSGKGKKNLLVAAMFLKKGGD